VNQRPGSQRPGGGDYGNVNQRPGGQRPGGGNSGNVNQRPGGQRPGGGSGGNVIEPGLPVDPEPVEIIQRPRRGEEKVDKSWDIGYAREKNN
jgi:hypothetical protein